MKMETETETKDIWVWQWSHLSWRKLRVPSYGWSRLTRWNHHFIDLRNGNHHQVDSSFADVNLTHSIGGCDYNLKALRRKIGFIPTKPCSLQEPSVKDHGKKTKYSIERYRCGSPNLSSKEERDSSMRAGNLWGQSKVCQFNAVVRSWPYILRLGLQDWWPASSPEKWPRMRQIDCGSP